MGEADIIWEAIAFENIIHDVAQALGIDDRKVSRIKDILFGVDKRAIRRFEARAMDIIERLLLAPYGSILSYYKSMGLGGYMEPIVRRFRDEILHCVTVTLTGGRCGLRQILDMFKSEIRQLFLRRKKPFMRLEFHDRRINDIFGRLYGELQKILSDYQRIRPPEKRFLELCTEIVEEIKDPIAYYNVVWTIGFLMKVLDFSERDRLVISLISKTFDSLLEACRRSIKLGEEGAAYIRHITDRLKKIFLHILFFPELLKDSRFLDKLPKDPGDIDRALSTVLSWLENDRSYGRMRDIAKERYEDEVRRVFAGRLLLDAGKIINILMGLEESLSTAERMDVDVALHLVHSLLFHQKAIQYTLSIVKAYLKEHVLPSLAERKKNLEEKLKHWRPFLETPDLLPSSMEDLIKEIDVDLDADIIDRMGSRVIEILKKTPLLSVSPADVHIPEALIAVCNYILNHEKPGSTWEVEFQLVVNGKYRIRRRVLIGKDITGNVTITERFCEENVCSEYVLSSQSMFKEISYKDYIDRQISMLYAELSSTDRKIDNLTKTIDAIDRAIECLMFFDVDCFHVVLRSENLVAKISEFLGHDFDEYVKARYR